MSIFSKPAPREKVVDAIFLPISPKTAKADLAKLAGLTEEDETLGAVLRVLTDLHGTLVHAAEQAVRVAETPHASAVAVARASGVAAAIRTIVAATRGSLGRHGHQETGFGAEEQ